MFKFSLGSFSAFPIFDNLVSRKRLVIEQNGPKFGPRSKNLVYRVLLSVKCSSSVWDHLVHFQFLTTLYLGNG